MPLHPWTAVGLILGMIGVIILFFWGPPQPAFQEYVSEHEDAGHKLSLSRIGLFLIFIGFAFQSIDAWKN
jgi:hypothetical protein